MLEVEQAAHVVSSEKLRAVVSFTLRISDKSTITQEIVMDATCPHLKFSTQVPEDYSWYLEINLEKTDFTPSISGEVG